MIYKKGERYHLLRAIPQRWLALKLLDASRNTVATLIAHVVGEAPIKGPKRGDTLDAAVVEELVQGHVVQIAF